MNKGDREQWGWSYSLSTGIWYGPIPLGFIVLGIVILAMVVRRLI